MEYTKNLRLSKPSYDDDVDVQVLNNNMDILDDRVGSLPYLPLKGGTMSGNITFPEWKGLHYGNNTHIDFGHGLDFDRTSETINMTSDSLLLSFKNSNNVLLAMADRFQYAGKNVLLDSNTKLSAIHGYCTLSNGVLLQWGYKEAGTYDGNVQHITFETPMKSIQYLVFVSKSNYDKGKPPVSSGEWYSSTYNYTSTGFDMLCDSNDTSTFWFWFAIGTMV